MLQTIVSRLVQKYAQRNVSTYPYLVTGIKQEQNIHWQMSQFIYLEIYEEVETCSVGGMPATIQVGVFALLLCYIKTQRLGYTKLLWYRQQ
jgi:hypothetical protein